MDTNLYMKNMAKSGMLSNPAEDWKVILAWQKIIENKDPFVDMGLSVKWGRCNLGADSPEEYGDYYAWGEIKTKREYTKENSLTYNESIMDLITGDQDYDAATAHCGKEIRLPKNEEFDELIDHTTQIWTEYNGVKGLLVFSDVNGNSIFLPTAGYWDGASLKDVGEYTIYWSSTPDEDHEEFSFGLEVGSGRFCPELHRRFYGGIVRPVRE